MFAGIFALLLGLCVIAFGIYVRRHPDFAWRMNEGWKVKGDSEPSNAYLDSMKFSGAAAIVFGCVVSVFAFLTILSA